MPQNFSNITSGASSTAKELFTLKEFGARIKSRYPQYAKYGDEEIGNRMLAKYPQYQENIKPFVSDTGARDMPATGLDRSSGRKILESLIPGLRLSRIATSPNPVREAGLTTEPSIMSEHAAEIRNVPGEIAGMVKNLPSAATATAGMPPWLQAIIGANAMVQPYKGTAKQAVELVSPGTVNAPTPESAESREAARSAMTNLALAEAPNVLSAAKPVVTGIGRLLQKGLVNAPMVNRWMGVSPKWLEHGADPGKQIIDSKLLASTKEATLKNVTGGLDKLGPRLDAKFASAANRTIDASDDVLNALQSGARDLSAGSDAAFQSRLNNILDTITREFPDLERLTPARARVLKTRIYDSMYFSGAAEEGPINTVLSKMSSGINTKIKANVPGIANDFREWGNLYQAKRALESGIARDRAGIGTGSMRGQVAKKVGKGAAIAGGAVTLEQILQRAVD